jgi:hypothetical protein
LTLRIASLGGASDVKERNENQGIQMRIRTSPPDPLLCDIELPLHGVYHPMGFAVKIATNSPDILAAADESWKHFRRIFPEPAVTLRIAVAEEGSDNCPPAPVCRAQQNLLVRIADARNYSVSDLARGFAFSWLTHAVAENRGYLRYHYLEGVAWDLLESLYLTSIHAACVSKDGRGILFCGDSGAGKSSLAFACARNGWTFLSDDSTCLVRGRRGRVVVGNPYQMRFRESATQLFPELKDQRVMLRATGEFSIEVPTVSLQNIRITSQCSVDHILFLNRGTSGPPRLVPFPKHKAREKFEEVICFGQDMVREAHRTSLRNLLTAEILEFRYNDLDSAVDQLEGFIRDGAPPSADISVPFREADRA